MRGATNATATMRRSAGARKRELRAELTVAERSEHIAEWIRLTEEREQAKAQLAPLERPYDRGRPNQGINAASRELGIERTEARRLGVRR